MKLTSYLTPRVIILFLQFFIYKLVPFVIFCSFPLILFLASVGLIESETKTRNDQVLPLYSGSASSKSLKVIIVLHRVIADENSVEASVVVYWRLDDIPEAIKGTKSCIQLHYGNRIDSVLHSPSGVIELDCDATISKESIKFALTYYSDFAGYPFDDINILPYIIPESKYIFVPVTYSVQTNFGGRLMTAGQEPNSAGPDNWQVKLRRPETEKVFVLAMAAIYVLTSFLVTSQFFKSTREPPGPGVLALAGYMVGLASMRDILGFSRVGGRTALEFIVFILTVGLLSIALAISAWRYHKPTR